MHRQTCMRFLLFFVLVVAVVACAPTPSRLRAAAAATTTTTTTPPASKPKVVIHSPASGAEFRDGEQIDIRSTSTDPSGVVRVELDVDDVATHTTQAPNPQGQSPFRLLQTWKATPGNHTLSVRAFNASGEASDPVGVKISVRRAAGSRAGSPSDTPMPVSQSATVAPASTGCTDNAAFVTDVTVPDGSSFAPGETFNKIWRLSNSGTCTWKSGYQLIFVSGEAMATITTIAVPETAPGSTADLLVAMTAPSTPGAHNGYWRLRNASAAAFGTLVSVKINVVSSAAPSQPPTQPPASNDSSSQSSAQPPATGNDSSSSQPAAVGCTGTPNIESFTADPSGFGSLGGDSTLSWGSVTNADAVEIDNGVGDVATPGSITVHLYGTTTYTLTAHCGSNTKTAQVTITVRTLSVSPLLPKICIGTPSIASFTANPTSFMPGGGNSTLSWGAVTNAGSVEIDNGVGGVATPGSTTVHVSTTTTFTLTAYCGSNTKTAQVKVSVLLLILPNHPVLPKP